MADNELAKLGELLIELNEGDLVRFLLGSSESYAGIWRFMFNARLFNLVKQNLHP